MSTNDHTLAAALATEAGELLLAVRSELAEADAADLKAAGDQRSHELLTARLAEARPNDAVLSEEGADDLARLDADRVWIVDPLDGTREFSEPPRTDWAVHVALWASSEISAAAVALPGLATTLSTGEPPALAATAAAKPRVIVSRTRPGPTAEPLVAGLDGELVTMGSAGAKAMAVVRGEAEVYAHSGGQYEWDSAAPVGVAAAAGLHVSRIDGTPLTYNNENPYLPDLLICRPELAEAVLAIVADVDLT